MSETAHGRPPALFSAALCTVCALRGFCSTCFCVSNKNWYVPDICPDTRSGCGFCRSPFLRRFLRTDATAASAAPIPDIHILQNTTFLSYLLPFNLYNDIIL